MILLDVITVVIYFDVQVQSRPPLWLRKVCQSYLQQIISKPDGVMNVLINAVHGIGQFLSFGWLLLFFITFLHSCTYMCF